MVLLGSSGPRVLPSKTHTPSPPLPRHRPTSTGPTVGVWKTETSSVRASSSSVEAFDRDSLRTNLRLSFSGNPRSEGCYTMVCPDGSGSTGVYGNRNMSDWWTYVCVLCPQVTAPDSRVPSPIPKLSTSGDPRRSVPTTGPEQRRP